MDLASLAKNVSKDDTRAASNTFVLMQCVVYGTCGRRVAGTERLGPRAVAPGPKGGWVDSEVVKQPPGESVPPGRASREPRMVLAEIPTSGSRGQKATCPRLR
jgi:hypothetical protein